METGLTTLDASCTPKGDTYLSIPSQSGRAALHTAPLSLPIISFLSL